MIIIRISLTGLLRGIREKIPSWVAYITHSWWTYAISKNIHDDFGFEIEQARQIVE